MQAVGHADVCSSSGEIAGAYFDGVSVEVVDVERGNVRAWKFGRCVIAHAAADSAV